MPPAPNCTSWWRDSGCLPPSSKKHVSASPFSSRLLIYSMSTLLTLLVPPNTSCRANLEEGTCQIICAPANALFGICLIEISKEGYAR